LGFDINLIKHIKDWEAESILEYWINAIW